MFKILTIGALIYLFYRIVFIQKSIKAPEDGSKLNKKNNNPQKPDDGEFVDYEEVD